MADIELHEKSTELIRPRWWRQLPLDTTRIFFGVCVAFCLLFLAWASWGKLDIVSMADGRVVPSSKVKEIQHLEGGIINEILVREGAVVSEGQPLVTLEGTINDASIKELEIRIASLEVDIIRLSVMVKAELGAKALTFPPEMKRQHADLVRQTEDFYRIQVEKFNSELASQRELIEQRQQAINEIETRTRNNNESLELLRRQIEISGKLLEDNLTTEYKHLSFLREESALKSKIEEDSSALKGAFSQLEESREKLKRIRHSFKEKASEELKKSRQELDEFTQRLTKYKDSLRRTVIRSPVEGVVKTLYFYTVGGVITPGKTIMDIVPTSDRLIIEAQLPIQDIGYVQAGQVAVIKLASPDARRYGKLDGEVVNVSPDAMSGREGRTFYTVKIKTAKKYFEWRESRYSLVPGMQVIAYIHTGKRTVLQYLLDPFVDSMGQALQER